MTWAQAASESPYLTAFVLVLLTAITTHCASTMWNRLLRFFTIRKHGYPPDYCDADGDSVNMLKLKVLEKKLEEGK